MAKRNSRRLELVKDVFLMYLVAIGIGIAVTVGFDALVHFVTWTSYSDFPWLLLRGGIAAGFAVMSVILMFCWAGAL